MAVMRSDQQYLEAVWPSISAAGVDGEYAVSRLHSVQERTRAAWGDMHGKHTRTMADATKTEAGRVVASAKFARNILAAHRAAYEEARESAAGNLRMKQAQLQRALNPPSDPGEAALYAEIRNTLRGMKTGDRIDAVTAALAEGGDRRVAHAAVSGPELVAMLPPAVLSRFRDQYWCATMPNEWGAAQRLSEALAEAQTGMDRLEQHAAEMVDFQAAEAYERAAA
ncbi:hypothetical protein [Rhodanobacter thiooxydans]|uniref:hypothetical protein n=1 Tax=Rhodanobacter thiooxydans TaxID=416169 RepID=UPI00131F461F|nr:hypothetical protein [Rhodanobacter thiooxydans]